MVRYRLIVTDSTSTHGKLAPLIVHATTMRSLVIADRTALHLNHTVGPHLDHRPCHIFTGITIQRNRALDHQRAAVHLDHRSRAVAAALDRTSTRNGHCTTADRHGTVNCHGFPFGNIPYTVLIPIGIRPRHRRQHAQRHHQRQQYAQDPFFHVTPS